MMRATLLCVPLDVRLPCCRLDVTYAPPRRARRVAPASLRAPTFDAETRELVDLFAFFVTGEPR